MNSRGAAIAILQKAREILMERLVERVVAAEQDILDDAGGHSYLSEIEAIYEQIGARLTHLGAMLATLPPAEETRRPDLGFGEPIVTDVGTVFSSNSTADVESHASSGQLALPAPALVEEHASPQFPGATFENFLTEIHAGNVETAARTLAVLFDLDESRARSCAETFSQRMGEQSDLMLKVFHLRSELLAGGVNGPLVLLWECFGLQGMESLGVLQTLKARVSMFDSHRP